MNFMRALNCEGASINRYSSVNEIYGRSDIYRTVVKSATVLAPVFGIALMIFAGPLQASAVYTYTSNTVQISFDLTGNSMGLAAGTNITPNVTKFSMTYPAPPVDFGGFPLGSTSFTLTSFAIGTDAQGNITTWDVMGDQFAFYPKTPTGNQNAFFCEYQTAFAQSGGSGSLIADQDRGFCPFATISEAANGLWSVQQIVQTPPTIPEPNSMALLTLGFLSLIGLPYWRKLQCLQQKFARKKVLAGFTCTTNSYT